MFACSVVISDFGFTDVVMFHHHSWELDGDLWVGMDGCLSLTMLLPLYMGTSGHQPECACALLWQRDFAVWD